MQKKIVSLAAPLIVGIIALALGWFAHAAVPLAAQGIVVDGHATRSDPAAPAAPAVGGKANLNYQGRLTDHSGAPINAPVSMTFRIYTGTPNIAIWISAARSVTPSNGLFTVYLGGSPDPDLPFDKLAQAASIGVTVGGDGEMTPLQALRSVVGHSLNEVGVVGSSDTGYGVFGSSNQLPGFGVVGSSNTGYGVVGQTGNLTRAGVSAQAAGNSGVAMEISRGGIKATGAGIGTNTFAFIHESTIANSVGFDTH